MSYKINKSKLAKRFILITLVLLCIGVFVANRIVKQYGFSGIVELVQVYSHNSNLADQVEPAEMQLIISDEDYLFLKNRRDVALERGIQINDGEDTYVDCKIVQGNDTVNGEIRLKGHMTDHLEGDKWSFRVKTKKKPVFGMTRFSLQAPGTRNYAYEWVYHQLLKREGIIYLNYDFIRLKLNEKDLGIYAIEEHFGQHVLDHNNRPNGAILRWNPTLYWEQRLDEIQGTFLNEQYSDFSTAFVEPYEKGTVADDSLLTQTYLIGTKMLEEFRRGEKSTSEIFDVEKLARFHAIIDLVGGHHSLDWSDVKFFYNSDSKKIEPVGYESFSVRKTIAVAGQRIPESYDPVKLNYHDQLFSDPVFYAAYIQELERICNESYFHEFIKMIQPELDLKIGILAHEFPYIRFSFDPYFENIELIRHNLELPKPFHAFLQNSDDSLINISLTPVSDFPVEILSLSVDGKGEFEPDTSIILPPKARNTFATYTLVSFHYTGKKIKNLKLKARIPGSSYLFEVDVNEFPSYDLFSSYWKLENTETALNKTPLSKLNDSVYFFNQQEVVINETITLSDSSSCLIFFPGQHVRFEENGRIISNGKVQFAGGTEEDERILITSSEASSDEASATFHHIHLIGGELICSQADFFRCENFLMAYESVVRFSCCGFSESQTDLINSYHSEITIDNCSSGKQNSIGTFDRSDVRISNFEGKNGDVFITSFGSDIDIWESVFSGFNVFADLNYNSNITAWESHFSSKDVIASIKTCSQMTTFGGTINQSAIGFELISDPVLKGESAYTLYQTQVNNVSKIDLKK